MLPNTKQKLKSDPSDVVSGLSSLSMPSLTPRQQLPMTKSFELRRNSSLLMRHKTTAETISETRRMLSNGVRLVTTRRPITPREPRRQLYGQSIYGLSDRPPSAFSLSYLQLENRVLPPIGTTARAPKYGSLNSVHEPATSIKTFNDETTFNRIVAQHNDSTGTNAMYSQTKSTKTCNESHANSSAGEKGDNSSNIAINLNIGTKNNRTTGQPKLPTLSTEMKIGTTPNSNGAQNRRKSSCSGMFYYDVQRDFEETTAGDVLDGEQITLPPLNDETNQSSVKKQLINETRRSLVLRGNDLLAQSSTETLLDMLKSHSGIKDCSEETILHINGILTELYTRVKGVRNDWRSSILSSLYGLVECTSAKILLSVARVVLVLDVTGSNLTGACKLVFKVARNERNDNLFANIDVPELLIDGLGRASPIDDAEACIYGYGAVRFLANAVVSAAPSGACTSNPSSTSSTSSASRKKHKTLACRLLNHGANSLMILHLQMINEAGAASKLPTQTLHALFQLSNAFRALSKIIMSDKGMQLILSDNNNRGAAATDQSIPNSSGCMDSVDVAWDTSKDFNGQITMAGPHLVRAAEICINQTEVQLSIIRTLSILSEHEACCDGLSDITPRLGILLGPILLSLDLTEHHKNNVPENVNLTSNKSLSILNRIGYILGNVMAKCDSARLQFYNNDVAMEYLLKCLEHFSSESLMLRRKTRGQVANETSNDDDTSDCQFDTVTDVVIKLIRVIANLSVNAEVGYKLANHHQLGAILLTLLNTINKHRLNFNSEFEELFLASLGAIHNLSFYQSAVADRQTVDDSREVNHPQSMIKQMATISAALCAIYQWAPESAQAEIARVLGNLTRSLDARVAVHSAGGFQFLLKNLSSNDWNPQLVEASCGVLVNMLSDWERRAPFREMRGPLLLRDVLQRSAMKQDWLLALIACQAMWNYIIDSGNVVGALGEDEADYISGDILEYLDEEKLFAGGVPDAEWEEFAVVAADLLERIQSSLSYNNSPIQSSDDESNDDDDDDDEFANSDVMKMSKTGFKMWLANS